MIDVIVSVMSYSHIPHNGNINSRLCYRNFITDLLHESCRTSYTRATGAPNDHRAYLLALDPCLFPNLHQRRSKCLRIQWHSNGSNFPKRAQDSATPVG